MILVNELKAKIVSKGLTNAKVAEKLNITPKTFYNKMNKGVFGSDEISKMIDILDIENPMEIFFSKEVS